MVQSACRCEVRARVSRDLALSHIERDELDNARTALLVAWRAAPQERIARLVELVDEKRGVTTHAGALAIGDGPATRARAALEKLEGIAIPVRRDRDVVNRWLVEATAPRRLGLRIVFELRGGLRLEVTRSDGRFTRVVFWRPSDLAQSMFPPDDISWALRSLGRRVDAVVDVRTPFYPGLRRTYGHPTKVTLRLVEGVVDELDAL